VNNLLTKFEAELAEDTNDDGISAMEYLVLAAVILVAVAAGAAVVAGKVGPAFQGIADAIS
jgi:Flp pilus assembly pilin Flp